MRRRHDVTDTANVRSLEGTTPKAPDALIEFHHVNKLHVTKKQVVRVLQDFDIEVRKFEFLCVVGPSGCGKSTLLNLISGLDFPDSGSIKYAGKVVDGVHSDVGYITQKDSLLPWRTVRANVALGLEIKRDISDNPDEAVQDAIDKVGLKGFESLHPGQLSGGMRKRVQLARTLVCNPKTLLLDEPFGALDAQMRIIMQQDLLRLRRERPDSLTAMFITHDLVEAVALGDRVVVLSARPARPIAIEEINDLGDRSDLMALQDTPHFREHVDRIWSVLSSQLNNLRG